MVRMFICHNYDIYLFLCQYNVDNGDSILGTLIFVSMDIWQLEQITLRVLTFESPNESLEHSIFLYLLISTIKYMSIQMRMIMLALP